MQFWGWLLLIAWIGTVSSSTCPYFEPNEPSLLYKQGQLKGRNDQKAEKWVQELDRKLSDENMLTTIDRLQNTTLHKGFKRKIVKGIFKRLVKHQEKISKLSRRGLATLDRLKPRLLVLLDRMLMNNVLKGQIEADLRNEKSILRKLAPEKKAELLLQEMKGLYPSNHHLERRLHGNEVRPTSVTLLLFTILTEKLQLLGVFLFIVLFLPIGIALDLLQMVVGLTLFLGFIIPVAVLYFVFVFPYLLCTS